MKKKFFDKSLIVEGLSQLKVSGFIFLIISVLGSAVPAIFVSMSYKSTCESYGVASANVQSQTIVSIQSIVPILLPVIYIAPFVFCLVLFSFLNNRKGSDYYHSLSFTRVSLFLSFTASILIWLALIVVSSVFAASLIYAVSGMIFNAVFIPYLIFTFFAAAALVTACMLLAMSITGTVLTNIIVFGLILFLPRFISSLSMHNIFTTYPIVSTNSGGLANISYNIPVNFVYCYLFNKDDSGGPGPYISAPAIAYTLILAAIYLAIACLLFHIRKSETAGSSAPNRILQHIYRCTITLPVALIIPIILSNYSSSTDVKDFSSYLQSNLPNLVTAIIISLLIYFLFELLTTKSVKKMIKSAPVLIFVIAFCAVYGLLLNAAKNNALNFNPSSSEIESITILPQDKDNCRSYSSRTLSYNELALENVKLSDDSLNYAVSETLDKNINSLKSRSDLWNQNSYYHVGICLKNGKYGERILFANRSQSSNILKCINSNDTYIKNSTLLPPESSISRIYTDDNSGNDITNQTSVNKLWNSYKSEYSKLSDSDKLSIAGYTQSRYYSTSSINNYTNIQVDGSLGVKSYENFYPITSKMPKTAAMYMNFLNAQNKSKAKSVISSFVGSDKEIEYCTITLYNSAINISKKHNVFDLSLATFEDSNSSINVLKEKKCLNILSKQIDGNVDLSKPFVLVTVQAKNKMFSYYQPLSEISAKTIKTIFHAKTKS